jgi:hypothetical protein
MGQESFRVGISMPIVGYTHQFGHGRSTPRQILFIITDILVLYLLESLRVCNHSLTILFL